jgi:dolichol-phosphate mannosyltransferase
VEGARISEVVVTHHPRRFGQSKYNLTRTFRVLMDLMSLNLFLKYLKSPLRFFGKIGGWFFSFGFVCACWAGYAWLVEEVPLYELNVVVTLLFLLWVAALQLLFIGLVASLIVRTGKRRSGYLSMVFSRTERM